MSNGGFWCSNLQEPLSASKRLPVHRNQWLYPIQYSGQLLKKVDLTSLRNFNWRLEQKNKVSGIKRFKKNN